MGVVPDPGPGQHGQRPRHGQQRRADRPDAQAPVLVGEDQGEFPRCGAGHLGRAGVLRREEREGPGAGRVARDEDRGTGRQGADVGGGEGRAHLHGDGNSSNLTTCC